jgi:hypothetical protein
MNNRKPNINPQQTPINQNYRSLQFQQSPQQTYQQYPQYQQYTQQYSNIQNQ